MKKIIALILALTFIFTLVACDNSNGDVSTPNNTIEPTQSVIESNVETDTSYESTTNSEATDSSTNSAEENVYSEPTESSEPIHTHEFSAATCIEPQKCSCGATNGNALGHNFSKGVCITCGQNDPDFKFQPITDGTWVASTNNGNLMFVLDFDPESSSFTYQSGGIGDGDSFTYVEDGNTIIVTDSAGDTITLERTENTILKMTSITGSYYGVGELMQPGVEFIYMAE